MFPTLLTLHSLVRWLVLIGLLLSILTSWNGLSKQRTFSKNDNLIRIFTVSIAHLQLILGLWLYFISPIVDYFLQHFQTAVHEREVRFFGMEHITMMVIAITLITIGAAKAKRKPTDAEKFKTMLLWSSVALLIIFFSIPWKFSPLTSRPYFRLF